MLLNLPGEAKSLIENKGFSVSRSDVPAGRCSIDMTIEQTTNKDAKTRGGIIGAFPHITDGVLHVTTDPSMFQLCSKFSTWIQNPLTVTKTLLIQKDS